MSNAVAVIDRQPVVPAFTMSDMERIATSIAKGGMFGSKDPHAVLTLCMLAQAEGQHPAVVFRDYDIIQGKPAKKAEAMMRDFLNSGGKVTWNRLDDECCDATFTHPQGGTATINWTLARAQKAQLGGKDNWKKWPRQMLRSRVVSEGVRTVCPNATSGLYVPEEVRDFDNAPANDTPATPQPQRARDLKPIELTPEPVEPDHHATLVELESIAGPGQADALAEAWAGIGKDARKALADELPRLKELCEPVSAGPDNEGEPEEEPDPRVNDLLDEVDANPQQPGDDPAAAKCNAIIGEIKAAETSGEVTRIWGRNADHIAVMDEGLKSTLVAVKDARLAEIKAGTPS